MRRAALLAAICLVVAACAVEDTLPEPWCPGDRNSSAIIGAHAPATRCAASTSVDAGHSVS